ncbi:MAG: hypothetical protein CL678_10070 [Bdellovibrionaceae bacterium]|nr:hypothetical protein [Pseudobdellovibrionaceae bacterium]|tara:strand:+ start:1424 stop:2590 length:1167 start_codon:yes stop_codon:yes gene_type:complete
MKFIIIGFLLITCFVNQSKSDDCYFLFQENLDRFHTGETRKQRWNKRQVAQKYDQAQGRFRVSLERLSQERLSMSFLKKFIDNSPENLWIRSKKVQITSNKRWSKELISQILLGAKFGLYEKFYEEAIQSESLSSEVKNQLSQALREHLNDRNQLMHNHMWVVATLSIIYLGKKRKLDSMDIFQEGIFGLTIAVNRFEPERGFALSGFADNWVRQSIARAIHNHGRTVRYPVHLISQMTKLKKETQKLARKYDRVTAEMLAEKTGFSIEKVKALGTLISSETYSLSVLDQDVESSKREEGFLEVSRHMVVPEETVLELTDQGLQKRSIADAMKNAGLSQEEKEVINEIFFSDESLSLTKIASKLGINRYKFRQLRDSALFKMKDYLEN